MSGTDLFIGYRYDSTEVLRDDVGHPTYSYTVRDTVIPPPGPFGTLISTNFRLGYNVETTKRNVLNFEFTDVI